MGREQRRKQNKKYNYVNNEGSDFKLFSISSTITTFVVFFLIIFISYFILAIFVTKEIDFSNKGVNKNNKNDSTSSNAVDNMILASKIFDQQESSYYVYFYDFNDEDDNLASIINNVSDLVVYRVNTSDGFNSKYVSDDKGNSSARTLDEVRVVNPTLIKVTDDSIVEYYEGLNNISSALSRQRCL